MSKKTLSALVLLFTILPLSVNQAKSQLLACKKTALSALRPIPDLKYKCRAEINDYEEEILKFPERIAAINRYRKTLEKFTYADWWKTSVADLNVCDLHKKAGGLSREEIEQFSGGYIYKLLGNNQIRVVIVSDPCYQTGYGGSNVFLLNKKDGKVFVSQALDGFYSRADNPIFVDFVLNGKEQIIELSTTSGGLNPTMTNYYFAIDDKTNRAVPKNLFLGDNKKLTNQITSMMLLEEPPEYGLPRGIEPLQVIKDKQLASFFNVFEDTGETIGEDNHPKFKRRVFRWNGKVFQ